VDVNLDASGKPPDVDAIVDVSQPVTPSAPLPPLSRSLVFGIAVLFGAATLGAALAPYLAVRHPLILIALNPWPRHVILVAPHTPLIPLVLVVAFRGLFSCIVAFEVGKHYGQRGIELFESRSPRIAGYLRAFERVFSRAAPAFLVLSPGPLTSTLAAVSGNSRWATWILSWLGFVVWSLINYQVGDWLKPWTAPILAFIQQYLIETTVACAVVVLGYQWFARKRRLKQV
jgi:membrane protein DedA with SNARE-associated domain